MTHSVNHSAARRCACLVLCAVLLLCGCALPPESTAQLLEDAQAACAQVSSYSTAYQMDLQVTGADGSAIQNTYQIYTDYDLSSGKSIQSHIQTISDGSYAQTGAMISYYAPAQEAGCCTRYFSYDQATWYTQQLEADPAIGGGFPFLEQLPREAEFSSVTLEGNPVYELKLTGPLSQLGVLFSLTSGLSGEETADLEAEFTLYLHRQTSLPYCASLTCTDPGGAFAEALGYAGGSLDVFSITIYYDGYNQVPEIEIPAAALLYAEDLGAYTEEPLPLDGEGRALLHASTAQDSPVVSIAAPSQFTLDEGFSNLCNAFYSVIADAGTVSVHFTLEEAAAGEMEAEILAEFDEAMALYAQEAAYSEITRAAEPMELELDGRTVRYDWLTYLYTYQNDSSVTGQTVLYCAEYNYWLELEDGLLLRCYGTAQITDETVGCPTPPVLAQQVLSDIRVSS